MSDKQQDAGASTSRPGSKASPEAAEASSPSVTIPRADEPWFCERGDFWGTGKQLLLCAKCGKSEMKRYDEPRHFRGVFTPNLYMICDECFDSLPGEDCPTCAAGEYPQYGVAPHECFWRKGPEFTIGQSTLLPVEQWGGPFVPDLEGGETWSGFTYPGACGVFYCPDCKAGYQEAWSLLVARIGLPPASAIEAASAGETGTGSTEGESAVAKPDAPTSSPHPHNTGSPSA